MSSTGETLVLHPEATAFVDDVRRHLADLDEETRDELVGGLEADLVDQLADGTPLGDPATYAAELRAAAGIPEPSRRRRGPDTSTWPRTPAEVLDRGRGWFLGRAQTPRLRPGWDLLVALRPAWWVLRAWVAVTLLDIWAGPYEPITLLPTLVVPLLGPVLLVVAIVGSALIGLGRLWPGSGPDRHPLPRLLLLAVNVLAVILPLSSLPHEPVIRSAYDSDWRQYDAGWNDAMREGMHNQGKLVTNIFAYDAAGQPIPQVQLVDQDGRPIALWLHNGGRWEAGVRYVACPARNGGAEVRNAFPFAVAPLDRGRCTADQANVPAPTFPLATLPPVTTAWPVAQVATPEALDPEPKKKSKN